MIPRLLTLILFAALAGAGFGGPCVAETFSIGPGKGFAKITIPDAWKPKEIDRGLEARSPDEEVYIWAEAFTDETIQTVMTEHEAYFTKQGVQVTGQAKIVELTRNGLKMKALDVPATWKGIKTVLQYVMIEAGLPSGQKLLLTEWASPEGDKMHDPVTTAILNSVVFGK